MASRNRGLIEEEIVKLLLELSDLSSEGRFSESDELHHLLSKELSGTQTGVSDAEQEIIS